MERIEGGIEGTSPGSEKERRDSEEVSCSRVVEERHLLSRGRRAKHPSCAYHTGRFVGWWVVIGKPSWLLVHGWTHQFGRSELVKGQPGDDPFFLASEQMFPARG